MAQKILEVHGDCQEHKLLKARVRACEAVQTLATAPTLLNIPNYARLILVASPFAQSFPVDLKVRLTVAFGLRRVPLLLTESSRAAKAKSEEDDDGVPALSPAEASEEILQCLLPSLTTTTWTVEQPCMGALLAESLAELQIATQLLSDNTADVENADAELELSIDICRLVVEEQQFWVGRSDR